MTSSDATENDDAASPSGKRNPTASWIGIGLPMGIAVGAGMGAATGNMGLWLGIGVAIGAALGAGCAAVQTKRAAAK